jgi:L-fucose mutarotase
MLLNIPRVLTPELLSVLDVMGHGDEIVIADGNFPAPKMAKETAYGKPIFVKGSTVPEMLDAILTMIPLDYLVRESIIGVAAPADQGRMPIYGEFPKVMEKHSFERDRLLFI